MAVPWAGVRVVSVVGGEAVDAVACVDGFAASFAVEVYAFLLDGAVAVLGEGVGSGESHGCSLAFQV